LAKPFPPPGRGSHVLIISHRFTTAMQADIVHVMEAGRIIESGTHTELVQLGGLYGLMRAGQ